MGVKVCMVTTTEIQAILSKAANPSLSGRLEFGIMWAGRERLSPEAVLARMRGVRLAWRFLTTGCYVLQVDADEGINALNEVAEMLGMTRAEYADWRWSLIEAKPAEFRKALRKKVGTFRASEASI